MPFFILAMDHEHLEGRAVQVGAECRGAHPPREGCIWGPGRRRHSQAWNRGSSGCVLRRYPACPKVSAHSGEEAMPAPSPQIGGAAPARGQCRGTQLGFACILTEDQGNCHANVREMGPSEPGQAWRGRVLPCGLLRWLPPALEVLFIAPRAAPDSVSPDSRWQEHSWAS